MQQISLQDTCSQRSRSTQSAGEPQSPGIYMHRVLDDDSYCVSFYGWDALDHYVSAIYGTGFRVVGHLIFPKTYASNSGFLRCQHESTYLLVKGRPKKPERPISDVLGWKYSENKHHPPAKSVSTLLPIIEEFSQPGGLVLDPFCSSASTLLAAKSLGRSYLGFELDPKYHIIASWRLEAGMRPPFAEICSWL